MTDRPILFSAPMVRALLDGRKTMTRRLAWQSYRTQKLQPLSAYATRASPWQSVEPGDRLWVRETFYETDKIARIGLIDGKPTPAEFRADWPEDEWRFAKWTPSIYMPRWASRLTLVVTETKMERLQEISEDDAIAEGMERPILPHWPTSPFRSAFRGTWNALHKPGNRWEDNPEVVAITFTVHKANIDRLEAAKQHA